MAKYIVLLNWTDQGIKDVKNAPHRIEAARGLAKKLGCEMPKIYMTIGQYDMVSVVNAPDDETAAKFALTIGSQGNVRTTTLKAFPEETMTKIIGELR